ncbi:MAG: hypothetical protein RL307_503 [Pseudomonadota bacterium]|jgi:branched-chain amino acid transport system permease protein
MSAHSHSSITTLSRPISLGLLVAGVGLALLPLGAEEFTVDSVTRMMILALFAMSLDLLQGVTGLVSLGHAAYFGLAGYALAFLTPTTGPALLWTSLPLSMLASGLLALVVGALVVRTQGIYFIMATMAFGQMVYYLFFDNKALGGSDGIYVNFRPDAIFFNLDNRLHFYYFTMACLVVVYLFLRRLLSSPFGHALKGIRINEHRMRAVGFNTYTHKLSAFTLAGALAGLAGYLWGAQTGFVNPELLGFHQSAHLIMMLILGGMGHFAGAIVGAFAFEYALHVLKDMPTVAGFDWGQHWQLSMGLFIVAVVIWLPQGILGGLQWLTRSKPGERS